MPTEKMNRPNNQLKIGGFVIIIVLVMVYGFVIQESDSRLDCSLSPTSPRFSKFGRYWLELALFPDRKLWFWNHKISLFYFRIRIIHLILFQKIRITIVQ